MPQPPGERTRPTSLAVAPDARDIAHFVPTGVGLKVWHPSFGCYGLYEDLSSFECCLVIWFVCYFGNDLFVADDSFGVDDDDSACEQA